MAAANTSKQNFVSTSRKGTRAQVQAHWRALDSLVDAQSGGNEAICRALDVFESAAVELEAADGENQTTRQVTDCRDTASGTAGEADVLATPQEYANDGSGSEISRRAYLRAEQGLALAREQLDRSADHLRLMAAEVEAAKHCISQGYEAEPGATGPERRQTRAEASLRALDRGELGCLMSPVDMTRAMRGLLRMHQSEFEMQETIVCSVGYETPGDVFTTYRAALDLRPFMDDKFLEQVQEVRQLSEELERTAVEDSSEKNS